MTVVMPVQTPGRRVDRFLKHPDIRGLAKSTKENYTYALKAMKRYCKHANIRVLDETFEDHLQGFLSYTQETRKVSGKTLQQYCNVIRMMMAKTGCPIHGFTYRLTNAERHEHKAKQVNRWLTEEDVKTCLEYRWPRLHIRNHLIVRLLAETGCRVREIAEIKVRDVDLEKRSIYIGISKTTCRHVFVSPTTRDLVKQYLGTGELFGDPDRKLFDITVSRIKDMIGKMLKDLGLKEPGRLTHVFRHWVATQLFYKNGMRIEDVAFILGDTREIIERVYLHPTEDMMRERVDAGFGWSN